MQNPEVIADWLDQLAGSRAQSRMTKWEWEFVESVAEQFDIYGSLSERQEEILERIYAERT
jgi:hypothetical protein